MKSSAETIVATASDRPDALALVANIIDVRANLPFKFAEDCTLERPTAEGLKLITTRLQALSTNDGFGKLTQPYEWSYTLTHDGYSSAPLVKEQWRYYVVRVNYKGDHLRLLNQVANISSMPIDLQSFIIYSESGYAFDEFSFKRHFARGPRHHKTVVVTEDALVELRDLFVTWYRMFAEQTGSDEAYPEICRALEMFDGIKTMYRHPDLQILTLFSIIEMLITHEPQGNGDSSLTHQISRKMPMIMKRFSKEVSPPKHVEMAPDKVWRSLYELRSTIAHGSVVNFTKSKYAGWRTQQFVLDYLIDSVSALVRYAIHDPILLRDLKEV